MVKRYASSLGLVAVFSVVYYCAGRLGLSLADVNAVATPVWPGTGLALAGLLLFGDVLVPGILLGAFLVNYSITGYVGSSCAIALGNTLEALLAASLVERFARGKAAFELAADIFRFLAYCAVPSTVLCATVGVLSLALGGLAPADMLGTVWITWWTGDLLSMVVVTPFLLVWCAGTLPRISWTDTIEAALLGLLLLVCGAITFGELRILGEPSQALAYLSVPVLLWAAFRFQQRGAVTAVAIMSAIAIAATADGAGPFAQENANRALLLLQAFICVHAVTMLVLAAVVSERRHVSSSLGRNMDRLRVALEAGKMGAWEWNLSRGIIRWSHTMEQIHGISPGTFAGTFESYLQFVHKDDRALVQQNVQQVLQGGSDIRMEYRLQLADQQTRWVESRGRLFRDAGGNPIRMTGVCMDISARKQAQQEREHLLLREHTARLEAERANRAKDEFLAVLSHELRTPLAPVMLTASMLQQDPNLPEHLRPDVDMIRRNIELEARLIDDLLDLNRVSRGKLQLSMAGVDLHAIVRRAIDISFPKGDMQLAVSLRADAHHVLGDAGRLRQVFWNLLTNARKFTPSDGQIAIRSFNAEDGKCITIEVCDSGLGIAPDQLPRLFAPFEQGDAARLRRAGGLGLGLAIARALVSAHGGTLSARSDGIGKGATFVVQLPVAPQAVETLEEPSNGSPAAPARPLRILLVEDHEGTLSIMRRLLQAWNHDVTDASSVASAIDQAERRTFDLVISDLGLPDGMGYDLMRSIGRKYGLKGIAISGYGMPADVQLSREAGFLEHLTKPVDIDKLEAAISRVAGVEQPAAT